MIFTACGGNNNYGSEEKEIFALSFSRKGDDMVFTVKETGRIYVERFFFDEIIRISGTLCTTV